ncbi:hypothetical protein Ddye_002843 [Dipteronia dyeriana]|uniref:DUF7356 domain-containing protein n=1 Tax=Dipteronia dyeriana TaxID=168575 RepID=A0AAE0CUX0_9ROSI|nr:hypothetical protein Ddye_002843 [Dipteronia dyeriana]
METSYMLLSVFFFLVLLVNDCSAADFKENVVRVADSRLDPNSSGTSSSNGKLGGSDLVSSSSGEGVVYVEKISIKDNSSNNESGSKGSNDEQKSSDDSNKEVKTKEGIPKKEHSSDEVKSKDVHKESGNVEDLDPSRKEGTQIEECDSSNKCMDKDEKFVACLRVPGNDSPDLSLLILNKAKGSLTVRISAPDYVWLEKTKVQLPEKDGKTLKVTVKNNRGTGNLIILKAGTGKCSLDFKDLIGQNAGKESNNSLQPAYFNFLSQKPIIAFASFAALLVVASVCMCIITFRRRQLSDSPSKYQRLDMELPVPNAGKSDPNTNNDGWDNSWTDDWDDEEAHMTPTLPVTPSLSSKGLAPRRLNKEGWKD